MIDCLTSLHGEGGGRAEAFVGTRIGQAPGQTRPEAPAPSAQQALSERPWGCTAPTHPSAARLWAAVAGR